MSVDVKRRKVVMARSIRLGHCVCNPKNPCPCQTFKEHNVCPCAGERLSVKQESVLLTRHVRKVGCASKIGQADLLRILKRLPVVSDPNLLVGSSSGDDAGVYRINDRMALVQTVDVFTPVVDDPFLFGQIAAANSVSDIYAMGGRPLTALSIIGFPIEELSDSVMEAILRGGMEKLAEAGCALVGGHSLNDEEIKCGFAVTGLMDLTQVVERNRAQAGDVLVLTKPLGTGMVAFAAQIARVGERELNEVGASMAELNRDGAELMQKYGAHACTDITGFGLAGHLVEMARGSGVGIEIDLEALPVFGSALYCLENQIIPGAIERNQDYSMAWVRAGEQCSERHLPILFDPQTSGGLLIALPAEMAAEFVREMHARGHAATSCVGKVTDAFPGVISVAGKEIRNVCGATMTTESAEDAPEAKPDAIAPATVEQSARKANEMIEQAKAGNGAEESCCSSHATQESAQGGSQAASELFGQFMKAANREGALDKRTKKLLAIALSVAQRCKPCLEIHMRGALVMGITRAEIDEAAQLAIAFAGCPAMMLYKEVCQGLGV